MNHGMDFSAFDPHRFEKKQPIEPSIPENPGYAKVDLSSITPIKPVCSSCADNEFSVIEIKPKNHSNSVNVLVCAKCGTVHGVVNDTSYLESVIDDLDRRIDQLRRSR